MELRQLEVFCRIVETRSFSKAAREVGLTQPTVSAHIKSLEEDLGIRLLDRMGKEALPTKEGEVLYRFAKRVLALVTEAKQEILRVRNVVKGSIKIAGSNIPGEYILPGLIARFQKRYPDISVKLEIMDSREVARKVSSGEFEIGVLGARMSDARLEYTKFLEDELVLAVPPDHPLAGQGRVTLNRLKEFPFVIRERGSGTRMSMEEMVARKGLDPDEFKVAVELGSTEAVKEGIKAGLGVSFISRRAIESDLKHRDLVEVGVPEISTKRHFYIVTHRKRSRSNLINVFWDYLLGKEEE